MAGQRGMSARMHVKLIKECDEVLLPPGDPDGWWWFVLRTDGRIRSPSGIEGYKFWLQTGEDGADEDMEIFFTLSSYLDTNINL